MPASTTTALAAPIQPFLPHTRLSLTVREIKTLSPKMMRIVAEGAELADFASDAFDDHLKLFLPSTDGNTIKRDYTPRAFDKVARQLTIDFARRTVTLRGKDVRLTPKEFDLLHYLVTHPNKVLPHRELLQAVWGPDYGDQVEYLRVFINQLRKKIESDPAKPSLLVTEPWVGYRFQLPR